MKTVLKIITGIVILGLLLFGVGIAFMLLTGMPNEDHRFLNEGVHVYIRKSTGRMGVYSYGKLERQFAVATGIRSGNKQREGDKRTPEGEFIIIQKRPSKRFTLSLDLDYPRPEDAARGLDDGLITEEEYVRILTAHRRGRMPPWNTRLGGAILIHGGRVPISTPFLFRFMRTHGCVRVREPDMKYLYERVPVGTHVTIEP